MSGELRQLDPLKVTASWTTASPLGVIDILQGAIDGDYMQTTRDNAKWAREHDRAGNATRVKNNNTGGTLAITVSASDPINDVLSRAVAIDDTTDNVVGVIVIRDLNGTTLVEADGCFLEDVPDATFGNTRGQRVWVWQCAKIRRFLGGHDLA